MIWQTQTKVCTLDPNLQVFGQQVMYNPRKNKKSTIKQPVSTTQPSTREYHKIVKGEETYYNKVKALKYLDSATDPVGHQKGREKLSAPRMRYQTQRMLQVAQDIQNTRCQDVLRARQYDGIGYRRVGKWLQHMSQTYSGWECKVNLSYHLLGLRDTLIQKNLRRRDKAKQ